jgi:transposase
MAELVSNELWNRIEPLLPPLPPSSPKGGRPWVEHRPALTGIIFVLKTGIPWQALPIEMGCGSGSTCWRRFAAWTRLAVWSKLHALLLTALGKAGAINLERAVIDSASVRAVFGGRTPVPIQPTVRKKAANAMC